MDSWSLVIFLRRSCDEIEIMIKPLPIVLYPDPLLKKRSRAVTAEEFKAGRAGEVKLQELVERMTVSMYEAEGLGLAAPQVGVLLRLWIADPTEERQQPIVVFNPVLSEEAGSIEKEEGCLSIPEARAKVKRIERVVITGCGLAGQPIQIEAEDLLSRVAQHETDHLDGVLFINRIGLAARFLLRGKLKQLEEEYEVLQRRKKK